MKKFLKAFLAGSSFPAFFLFFIGFHGNSEKYNKKNCISRWFDKESYFFYTLIAPPYMGLMSVLAVMINQYFKITIRKAFFIISIISPILVSVAITQCNIYTFSKIRLKEQYLRLLGYHMFLFNIIIANIYILAMS